MSGIDIIILEISLWDDEEKIKLRKMSTWVYPIKLCNWQKHMTDEIAVMYLIEDILDGVMDLKEEIGKYDKLKTINKYTLGKKVEELVHQFHNDGCPPCIILTTIVEGVKLNKIVKIVEKYIDNDELLEAYSENDFKKVYLLDLDECGDDNE